MTNNVKLLPFNQLVIQKIDNCVTLVQDYLSDCTKIVLFGSYAKGTFKATSDLDILVLTERLVNRELRGELLSVFDECNVDLVIYTEEDFENSSCLLVQQIRKEGVLLWER